MAVGILAAVALVFVLPRAVAAQAPGPAAPLRPAAGPRPPRHAPATPPAPPSATPPELVTAEALVDAITLAGDGLRTTLTLELTRGITAEVFTLADPPRVIVDLPGGGFRLPEGTGRRGRGLVSAFRYGLFAEHKARLVLDATGPVRIDRAEMRAGANPGRIRFVIEMLPTDAVSFGKGTGAQRSAEADSRPAVYEDAVPAPKATKARPVIVIDPGHGGIDPGASGSSNLQEKTVVLAVGRALEAALKASHRYDVTLTRATDVFISLDQRLNISKAAGADLFISLHADSVDARTLAAQVRGATVYTLSERASDEEARRMADKENSSDLVAGLVTAEAEGQSDVRNILIDLIKRETANFSTDLSHALVHRMGKSVAMSRDPNRAAAFKVLRQTSAPSVLIELGYITNPDDERLMQTPEWRRTVVQAITGAVDQYFAKRTAAGSVP